MSTVFGLSVAFLMNAICVRFSAPVCSYQVSDQKCFKVLPNILIHFIFTGPPKFTDKTFKYYVVSAEHPVELMIQLQSHSREIASCHVTKYPGSKPDVEGKLPVDEHNPNEECLR